MCGVAAVFGYRSPGNAVERAGLDRMVAHMGRRGPDGAGAWWGEDGRVGLGHRRLSIIDLSAAGAQPMQGGSNRIVFNGEIYNYRALRTELEQKGYTFTSGSDTEVLLQLYADRGERMVDALRGMYAFALWDETRQGLLLARDPFGIKPLYVADDGRTVRVASQVKALLAGGGIDTAPEAAGHVGFFLWGHIPDPFTLYRGIRALPAGHTQWIDAQGARSPRAFASIPETLRTAAASPSHLNGDAPEFLRTALLDTVRHHLVADVDVGVFLSAGLDSTTLAALATEVGGRVKTVTLGFEEFRGTPSDEVPLAETAARHYATDHTTVWVTRSDFAAARADLMAAMDQPTLDGVNTYFVSQAAAHAGLKVALSGLGADELLGGYPSFQDVPRLVRWGRFVPVGVGRALRVLTSPAAGRFTSPKYAGVLEYGGTMGGAYLLRRGVFMPWELPRVLGAEFAREGWAALQTLEALAATTENLPLDRFRVTALESTWYMRHQLLRDADWASMAHSLEVRVPFVDAHLLLQTAPILAAHPDLGKQAMAAAARPALPPEILNRKKTGFGIPVHTWLQQEREAPAAELGLRGWMRHVYEHFTT